MANVPVRFIRFGAKFDDLAKARPCAESSGSEHSADLSDLVNSFLEGETSETRNGIHEEVDEHDNDINDDDESERNSRDFEARESLKLLFDIENDDVKRKIHAAVENACRDVFTVDKISSPEFKRRVMAQLRDKGFDAGLCKSKWEKNGRCTSGDYEYIDVNTTTVTGSVTRYIIEVNLSGEFTIARPTDSYASLLEHFPKIFVGKPDELKQVVRLMCTAMRKSMKSVDINVPPWRRHTYLQNKWFGSYKRTVNEISGRNGLTNLGWKLPLSSNTTVGFVPVQGVSLHCREGFTTVGGVKIGNLAAALR